MHFRLLIIAALSLSACSGGEEKRGRPTPLVTTAAVTEHLFADRYAAVGNANANEQVSVRAPVTERITRLGFTDGAFVQRGQMLAVLAQGQETASLASAQARVTEAEKQLARIAELHRRGFATNASLEAETANAASARAAANEAGASVGDRVVRAPFSGQVSLRRISVGAVVSAGDEIATVSDVSSIKLDFTIPETMLANVSRGQTITAKAAAFPEAMFSGRIEAIDPGGQCSDADGYITRHHPQSGRDVETRHADDGDDLVKSADGDRGTRTCAWCAKATRVSFTCSMRSRKRSVFQSKPARAMVIWSKFSKD